MEQLERALLRLEARLDEVLERLLARCRRAAAYNASMLVLLERRTRQTAGRVVCRAVPDLCTSANGTHCTALLRVIVLILARAIRHIGFYLNRRFFSNMEQVLSL